MAKILPSARSLIVALTLSLALSACVVGPPTGYSVGFVTTAPPAPIFESPGLAPGPGWFWINGYWSWNGGRYVWSHGYWQAPRRGYRWVPNRWERSPRGWRSMPGHWSRSRR